MDDPARRTNGTLGRPVYRLQAAPTPSVREWMTTAASRRFWRRGSGSLDASMHGEYALGV
jgi:hypothetical protein